MILKALILEDDEATRSMVSQQLSIEGFEIVLANAGQDVVKMVLDHEIHICALSAQSPTFDGCEIARQLRKHTGAGVIMLGVSRDEADIVIALEMGADDYVTRTVHPREFTARVRTILRRTVVTPANDNGSRPLPESFLRRVNDLEICSVKRSVRVGERTVELTPIEFDVLASLAAQMNSVLSRAKIIELSRGDNWYVSDRSIDQVISRLRQKLFDGDPEQTRIKTVHGRGYMLVET